jgi:PTH1 family peptidyl-tRNA hydrolase
MENKQETNKLYICLGNIGKEYEETRHNAGFIFGEKYIAQLQQEGLQAITKEEKTYTSVGFPNKKIYFLFPKTLMNLSGRAVNNYLSYTNKVFEIVVVHDDLDLLLGDYKIIFGKGPKTHNGLSSVEEALNTNEFERIRIGIENRNGLDISGLDYVLYKFNKEELELLNCTLEKLVQYLNP